jgi:hypothetical protein
MEPGDSKDEYKRMSECITIDSMYIFCRAVVGKFGLDYLRGPNEGETVRVTHGDDFLECLEEFVAYTDTVVIQELSFAWQGLYKGHRRYCSVALEVVADQDMWISHSFLCTAGSHNNINVSGPSQVFAKLVEGHSPLCNYEINGHLYTIGYYLVNGSIQDDRHLSKKSSSV